MEALFFKCLREDAVGVASSDDLPSEPVTDALRLEDPSPLTGLTTLLDLDHRPRPLRDATCRSFPVWELGGELAKRVEALGDDEIDDLAERWLKHYETSLDADAYELAECLADLRESMRRSEPGESLFVLLEERAI